MEPLASRTSFVVDHLLPWPDEGAGRDCAGPFEPCRLIDAQGNGVGAQMRKVSPLGAMIRTESKMAAGQALSIELGSGLRQAATVDWARGDEAGITFAKPLDMLALLNRHLIAQPAERRACPRIEHRCHIHVKWCENIEPATVRNVSSSGIQIEGDRLPDVGTLASLFLPGLNLPASEAIWKQGRLAGFEFFEEVRWSSLIAWIREESRPRS